MRILSPQVGIDRRLGGGRYDYEVLAALARLGHDVRVLLPRRDRGTCAVPAGCAVEWIRARWRWHPFGASVVFLPALLHAARRFRPDIIRVHSPACLGLAALAVGRITGIPTVASFHHAYETYRGARWTETHLLGRFDHVVTLSEFSRSQLLRFAPHLADRSTVTYAGVSAEFGPDGLTDRADWKRQHGLPAGPLFVTCGALIRRKNTPWLIGLMKAWVEAGQRGHLVIVGDGPEHRPIAARITELGLDDHVALSREADDPTLMSLLRAADAFLFPSLMEGFGLAVVEAMACGVPVIVSDRGALPEIVRDGCTGFVLSLDCGYAPWLEAMSIIVSDPARGQALVAGALDDVRRRFAWDRAAREIAGACAHAIEGSSTARVAGRRACR